MADFIVNCCLEKCETRETTERNNCVDILFSCFVEKRSVRFSQEKLMKSIDICLLLKTGIDLPYSQSVY